MAEEDVVRRCCNGLEEVLEEYEEEVEDGENNETCCGEKKGKMFNLKNYIECCFCTGVFKSPT